MSSEIPKYTPSHKERKLIEYEEKLAKKNRPLPSSGRGKQTHLGHARVEMEKAWIGRIFENFNERPMGRVGSDLGHAWFKKNNGHSGSK